MRLIPVAETELDALGAIHDMASGCAASVIARGFAFVKDPMSPACVAYDLFIVLFLFHHKSDIIPLLASIVTVRAQIELFLLHQVRLIISCIKSDFSLTEMLPKHIGKKAPAHCHYRKILTFGETSSSSKPEKRRNLRSGL